ncbi:hypothetical protein [Herbaspirillum rubrisubalbicans]|uniref:hypothetical protein n=1 Tax=Herbaspirillum rubrisubalbicans TaxID=80842 RepID=UPI00035F7B87|nr:hypothetical protein [Herbaspirillum rubrisubalbicans]
MQVTKPDGNAARKAYDQTYSLASIALVTVEDDMSLYGEDDASQILSRLKSIGVQEVAIKRGNQSCLVYFNGSSCNFGKDSG